VTGRQRGGNKVSWVTRLVLAEVLRICWKYRHYSHEDFLVLDRLSLISPHHTQPSYCLLLLT